MELKVFVEWSLFAYNGKIRKSPTESERALKAHKKIKFSPKKLCNTLPLISMIFFADSLQRKNLRKKQIY